MTVRFAALLLLTLPACDHLPRDPEGTTERVCEERAFRAGLVEGDAAAATLAAAYLRRVEAATGARAALARGPAEPLLARLRDGELDLVIGTMSPASPWEQEVHFLPALNERVKIGSYRRIVPMAAHGENRWIALLDREARALADR